MNKLLVFIVGMFLISLTSAQLTFEPEVPADIKVSCFDGDSAFCSVTATCNITIFSPNMTIFVDNQVMTNNLQYFNYETPSLNDRGEYNAVVQCIDGATNGYTSFTFLSTDISGNDQGIVAVGILFSIMALAFLFLIIGFKFLGAGDYAPVGLFFLLMAIILGVYTINLGYQYNRDLLISNMTTSGQFTIFTGVVWGLIAVGLISMVFLIFKTVGELRERKAMANYGEYYDAKTKQYK